MAGEARSISCSFSPVDLFYELSVVSQNAYIGVEKPNCECAYYNWTETMVSLIHYLSNFQSESLALSCSTTIHLSRHPEYLTDVAS